MPLLFCLGEIYTKGVPGRVFRMKKKEMDIMKVLFCNIAWMQWYKDVRDIDVPQNGGAYVNQCHTGSEVDNFWPLENTLPELENVDGSIIKLPEGDICLGFVETGHTKNGDSKQLKIERIDGCEALKNHPFVEDVLVIFCATRVGNNYTSVVGWYNHATVCRNYFVYPYDDEIDLWKNIYCKASDAVLLPVEGRKWRVPRAAKAGWGFGQSNVWYAEYSKNDETQPFVEDICKKIIDYDGPNILYEEPIDIYGGAYDE